jgi:Fe2+ or Zn2+ uptake regulation protein
MLAHVSVGASSGYMVCDEGPHHHLVCATCQTVVPIDAGAVETEIQRLARRLQFRLLHTRSNSKVSARV